MRIASDGGSTARSAGVGQRVIQACQAGSTRTTGVCCSITSLTRTAQGLVPGTRQPVVDTNVRRVVARLVHGRAEAAPARAADLADVAALAPVDDERAVRFSVSIMELGALVCVAGTPRCGVCPVRDRCAWRLAGSPASDGPPRRVQAFAGTDRQVRGKLLDVLRAADEPVGPDALTPVWDDAVQRSRCLDSLLTDGLVEQTSDGHFRLPTGDVDQVT